MRLLCLTLTLLIAFTQSTVSSTSYQCNNSTCPTFYVTFTQRGDGLCDLLCNIEPCGFDKGNKTISDCSSACEETGCPTFSLGNGNCDTRCNNEACGWDDGDCGYCAQGCYIQKLGNGVCNSECDKAQCYFDGQDCVRTT